ncbi:MAG: hypothetical protein JSS49_28990 [Planctomycetes bacterium]|nr:hypothetical protein [Planctomycetota bacterium]
MSTDAHSSSSLELPAVSEHPLMAITQQEFMDVAGRFTFRTYLGGAPPDDRAADLVLAALSRIVAAGGTRSNSQLYDDLHSHLCGPEPLEREALLKFLSLCADAIRLMIRSRAESSQHHSKPDAQAARPTFEMNSPTTIYLAEQFPTATLSRLKLRETFSVRHPEAGLVFELSDFVGCTDEEIGRLLGQPAGRIKSLRIQAIATIYSEDPQ